jgi:DinB superfamily
MPHNVDHTVALLSRTPAALDALLRDLPDAWTAKNEGGESWTPLGVVGHLVHCEHADWMPRVRMILEFGETRTFAPLDREARAREQSLADLLDEFARLRAANLAELRGLHLGRADFDKRGRHPRLGAVTLSNLLGTWATHDLTHLHQISRVMAYQYRDEVGPFRQFLGVLKCEGHSD